MDQRRAFALATVINRAPHGRQRLNWIGAVTSLEIQRRGVFDQPRNVAAGSLYFNRNTDRITVVFEEEHDRQLQIRRGIERFPKLPFAAGAVAEGNVSHFVVMKTADPFL